MYLCLSAPLCLSGLFLGSPLTERQRRKVIILIVQAGVHCKGQSQLVTVKGQETAWLVGEAQAVASSQGDRSDLGRGSSHRRESA